MMSFWQRLALNGVCCLLLLISHAAYAAKHLALPAAPLAEQLRSLSRQYGVAILYKPQDVKHLHAMAVNGVLTFEQALASVLHSQPLSSHKNSMGIVLKPSVNPADVPSQISSRVISEVVVSAYQQQLSHALQLKQADNGISDAIVAADIARFPNLNMAEALQRISGVNVSREAGEGRQVSLRGMSPDFTLVRLNGFDVLGNSDSPMDSRGQKTRNRAFDFNIFAAELFSAVQVNKTYLASQSEGGIAGTIDLTSPKPFDYRHNQARVAFNAGYNDLSQGGDQRASGLLSLRNEHWGWLLSLAHSRRETQEQGANTFRWRQISGLDLDISALDDDLQSLWRNGEIYHPRGNRYSVWQSQQFRTGLTQAIQFQQESAQLSVEWLYSELENQRDENHLYLRGDQSTPVIGGETVVHEAAINDSQALVYARYSNARMATESRKQEVTTSFNHVNLNGTWQFSEQLSLAINAATEFSELDMPKSQKVYTRGVADVAVDYRTDPYYAHIHYETDPALTANWRLQEIDLEQYFVENGFDTSDIVVNWKPDQFGDWQIGVQAKRFQHEISRGARNNLFRDQWALFGQGVAAGETVDGVVSADNTVPDFATFRFSEHQREDWLAFHTDPLIDALLNDQQRRLAFTRPSDVTEHILSFYVAQTNHYVVLNLPFTLDWALRYSRTETDNTSVQFDELITVNNRYHHWLPSVRSTWELSDSLWIKAAYAQNISRPQLEQIAQNYRVEENDDGITLYAPNPGLKPFFSHNYDLAVEWYFADQSLIAINAFLKRIEDYVVTTARVENHNVQANLNAQAGRVVVIRPDNAEQTTLKGVELSFASVLSTLPAPWDNLGVKASMSFYDGDVSVYDEASGQRLFRKRLPNQSAFSYDLALFYETDQWGLSLNTAYRDRYISQIDTGAIRDEDERGFHATQHIDASAYLYLSDALKLSVDALNLSNEREEQYSGSADRAYNTTQHGRSYFLGLEYVFW